MLTTLHARFARWRYLRRCRRDYAPAAYRLCLSRPTGWYVTRR